MSATIETTHPDTRRSKCEWKHVQGIYCPACGKFNHVWVDLLEDDYYVGCPLVCLVCASSFTLQPEAGWANFPSSAPWNPDATIQEAVVQLRAALAADPSLGPGAPT